MTKDAQRQVLEDQQAQSVYKLAILRRYLTPMVAKLARLNRPVMLVDGFAGTGYSGGDKGSSSLMLGHAVPHKYQVPVRVRSVEADSAHYDKLRAVVEAARAAGADAKAIHGTVQENLDTIVGEAAQETLFMFLDPYGANVPYRQLERVLSNVRSARFPPTEALLNISCPLIFREAGVVKLGSRPSQTRAVDEAMGGDWWHRYVAPGVTSGELVKLVTGEYARRLAAAAGMSFVVVPIHRHPGHVVPIYHLVYLTRSPDHGISTFVDAVARARPDYLEATEDADVETLFGPAPEWARQQAASEAKATQPRIMDNLRALAATGPDFCPFERPLDVYGQDLGIATETQVNAAIKALLEAGEIREVKKHKKRIQGVYASADTGISSQVRPSSSRP